jgi:hypothetical protein
MLDLIRPEVRQLQKITASRAARQSSVLLRKLNTPNCAHVF